MSSTLQRDFFNILDKKPLDTKALEKLIRDNPTDAYSSTYGSLLFLALDRLKDTAGYNTKTPDVKPPLLFQKRYNSVIDLINFLNKFHNSLPQPLKDPKNPNFVYRNMLDLPYRSQIPFLFAVYSKFYLLAIALLKVNTTLTADEIHDAFIFAMNQKNPEAYRFLDELIKKYPMVTKDVSYLVDAIKQDNRPVVAKLLTEKNINQHYEGAPPLAYAVINTSINLTTSLGVVQYSEGIVPFLLWNGAHIDETDEQGNTPLMTAVLSNRVDMTKYLIRKGANIYYKTDKGQNLRDLAELTKNQEMINLFPKMYEYKPPPSPPPDIDFSSLQEQADYFRSIGRPLSLQLEAMTPEIESSPQPQQEYVIMDAELKDYCKLLNDNFGLKELRKIASRFYPNVSCLNKAELCRLLSIAYVMEGYTLKEPETRSSLLSQRTASIQSCPFEAEPDLNLDDFYI